MRAVVIRQPGGPEVLEIREVPTPEPGVEQVRVRVHGAGLNRADLSQRLGKYPAPAGDPADIPGLEFAGVIDAIGPNVRGWTVGQRVYAICGGGGQAEYVVAHQRMLAAVPDRLEDLVAAGGVPEVFATAYDALFTQASLTMGETVLLHAVGSGIGTAGLQLAKAAGARTIGTSRSAWKLDRARALGLDVALPGEDFPTAVLASTEGRGVDVVLDAVGGPYVRGDVASVAVKGRIVLISALGGADVAFPGGQLTGKRATLMGSVLRARPLEEKALVMRALAERVGPLLAAGTVKPIVDRVFALADVQEAHAYLEANQGFGKVILRVA